MNIKSLVKSNKAIYWACVNAMSRWNIFLGRFFPKYYSSEMYRKVFQRRIDWEKPRTLNEKLMYYKVNLYWNNTIVSLCTDKYRVREFIDENGCHELLNPLLGVWNDARDIDWDSLPSKFVLKCNHGSGYNIICKDKDTFNIEVATKKLNNWLGETYGYGSAEQGIYYGIKRRIIAEQFIETKDGLPPADYKYFCSYGKVKLLFIACDRYDGNTKFDYYYPDWTWIPVTNDHPNKGPIDKPGNLEEMIRYAEKLSKRFPLIRIDFYNVEGKIIFGELTFTHFGCIHRFCPDKFDYEFGSLFEDVKVARSIL